ncbi:hypothetical protein GW17_00055467 [Ensete ventricosum]|nr:hypothetical protein GW17_00055467 [Ensete ventricosum]
MVSEPRQRGRGAASHGQPPCRVGHPRPRPPIRGWLAAVRASLKGRPAAPAWGGSHPWARPVAASRGGGASCRGGHPLAGWLPVGKGSCRLRRGNDGGDAEGERGVRASFGKRMILPL